MPVVVIGSDLNSKSFDWEKYETEVYTKIINSKTSVNVIWDLQGMDTVPPLTVIIKQLYLLSSEKEKIRDNIIDNTIIIKHEGMKEFLDFVFNNLYTPQNPVKIVLRK